MGDLVFIFCSDDFLLNMNKEYLEHDYFTDIITFDYSENDKVAGEMYISIDRIMDNAKSMEIRLLDEVHRVIIHGVLVTKTSLRKKKLLCGKRKIKRWKCDHCLWLIYKHILITFADK
jgi:hypothetical protein